MEVTLFHLEREDITIDRTLKEFLFDHPAIVQGDKQALLNALASSELEKLVESLKIPREGSKWT